MCDCVCRNQTCLVHSGLESLGDHDPVIGFNRVKPGHLNPPLNSQWNVV